MVEGRCLLPEELGLSWGKGWKEKVLEQEISARNKLGWL